MKRVPNNLRRGGMSRVKKKEARMFGVGTWRPAILTAGDVIKIKVAFAILALWRASDYAADIIAGGASSDVVEKSLPPTIWVTLCASVGLLILGGIILRIHWAVFYGHALGVIVYLALSVGALQHAFTTSPPDDWRRGGAVLGIAVVHASFARRSGPRPLDITEETTAESVVAPNTQ